MSSIELTNMSSTAKRRGFVCLVLFVLSLFSSLMTTNNMMAASSMTTMDHTMSQMHSEPHNMSSHCTSDMQNHCGSVLAEHDYQNCMNSCMENCIDSHCSSFSGLLVSYRSHLDKIHSAQTILKSEPYASTLSNTPYIPPIIFS